jgi:prophage regulatory protein
VGWDIALTCFFEVTAMTTANHPTPIVLDLPGVASMTSLSVSTVEKLVREGHFPKPRLLSGRRVGYLVKEVEDWCNERPVSDLLPPAHCGHRHGSGKTRTV